MHNTAATILGTTAALSSTIAFVPQIKKTWQTGGKDLSYVMLSLYVTGVSLWFFYGLAIRATALSLANGASILFAGACLVLKSMREKRTPAAQGVKRLRIAIDMDETIADSLKEHIRRYNAEFREEITPSHLYGKHIKEFAPTRADAVQQMLHDESFFDRLDVIEDAQEIIGDLAREHEIFIVSSACEIPESFAAKYRWLRSRFPFIPPKNIVFCGDKGIIDADYLIDDEARHFRNFRGEGILFSAPHNLSEIGYERVASWREIHTRFVQQKLCSETGKRGPFGKARARSQSAPDPTAACFQVGPLRRRNQKTMSNIGLTKQG
jgi:5'(3')-deoxyribonucleotidase/uncharacterized protein with PQ loop repeat